MNIEPTASTEKMPLSNTNVTLIALLSVLGIVVIAGSFVAGAVSAKSIAMSNSPSLLASVISALAPTTAATADLSIGTDSPGISTIQANATAPTNGIVLHTFTLTPKGTDSYLHSLVAQLSAQPNATSSAAIIRSIKLYAGTTLLDSEVVYVNATTTSVKFQNLNLAIPANTTQKLQIIADINPLDGKGFVNGAGIAVSVRGVDVGLDTATASCGGKSFTVNGSTVGNLITFMTYGISADSSAVTTAVATTASGNSTQQTGTFTLTFNVTAFGQDIYIPTTANAIMPQQLVDTNGNATTTQAVGISSTAQHTSAGNFVIHPGQTQSFTVTFSKLGQGGIVQGKLTTLKYGTSDQTASANVYTFPSTYITNAIMLQGVTTSTRPIAPHR